MQALGDAGTVRSLAPLNSALKQATTPQLEAEIRHTIAAILARIGPIEAGRLSLLDDTAGGLSRPEQDGELTLERDR